MLCNKLSVSQVLLQHTSTVSDTLLQKISCGLFWLLLPVAFPKFSYLLCFPGWKTASPRLKFFVSFSFLAISVFSSPVHHLRHRHV